MNLATLPDDELLQVLRFLGNRELLRCRGVCRRLRDAALHPHLWRKRSLRPCSDGVELCAAVLRLAPCLGTLSMFVWPDSKEYLQLGTLLAATNCAISELDVTFTSDSVCLLLAMLLARQAALGRLTSVSVSAGEIKPAELQLVLDQLLHTPGLTSIVVSSRNCVQVSLGLALPKAAKSDAIPASLRRLQYCVHDGSRLLSYLQTHADTLQVVDLNRCKLPAGTSTLLGSLPRLQELGCPMMENMPALLQCPSLETLYLHVRADDSTRKFLPGVQQFLRQAVADRLEDLTLEYQEEEFVKQENTASFFHAVNLVLSLAGPSSSAPSALRSLSLNYMLNREEAEQPQPQLQPLAAVLHRLDNLESLDLGGPPTADFLAALDGRVLPRLELLRVYLRDVSWGGGCPHEWAHGPEPRDLLRKYPRLHLKVVAMHENGSGCADCDYVGCYECECDFCERNSCHDFQNIDYTLFSHPEHEVCNQQHEVEGMRIDCEASRSR